VNVDDTPPYLHQLIAEQMRHELASRRLEVVLVPSPVEHWPTDQQRRVVCERNPAWYRELCRQYQSNRARPRQRRKPDTLIKRRHVLRALGEIEDGRLDTEYARRVIRSKRAGRDHGQLTGKGATQTRI
jgi:hypothetical protein